MALDRSGIDLQPSSPAAPLNGFCAPLAVVVSVAAAGAVFFAFFGAGRSLWLDEAYSANIARLGWTDILSALKADTHPPLYYLLLAGWTRLFGESEIALRSMSALFYFLTIPTLYAIVRTAGGCRDAALLAAFLFLVGKPAIAHAQNARMYSLLCLITALTYLAYMRAYWDRRAQRLHEAAFVLAASCGMFVHFWFVFALAGIAIAHAVMRCPPHPFRPIFSLSLAMLPFGFLWMPILLRHQMQHPLVSLAPPNVWVLAETLADYYGKGLIGGLVLAAAAAAVCGRHILYVFKKETPVAAMATAAKQKACGPLLIFFFAAFLFSLLLPFLVSLIKPIYRVGSYTIIGLPPLAAALGVLLACHGARRLVYLFCAALLAGSIILFARRRIEEKHCSDRSTAQYLAVHVQPGDTIIFTSLSRPAIEYYFRRFPPREGIAKISFPKELEDHPGWRNPRLQMANHAALAAEADNVVQSLAATPRKNQRVWLLYGVDTGVASMLKDRLDATFRLEKKLDLQDTEETFYTCVLVYRK